MTTGKNIKNKPAALIITAAAAILFFSIKNLFFFDEDVFVANLQSSFMQQNWQRSVLVKQLFKIQHSFFGINPLGYHFISLILHFLNAITAYLLFKKMLAFFIEETMPVENITAAFLILFLFTPVHSEPLSYLLAQGVLVFSLLAQWCVLFFLKSIRGPEGFYFLSLLSFAFSLLCYEISWMLPVIILTLIFFSKSSKNISVTEGLRLAVPFFIVFVIWLVIKYFFVSRSLVADYENITFSNQSFLKLCRNSIILFARNFIPPFSNTAGFVITGFCTSILIMWAGFKLFFKNKQLFNFSLLLLLLTLLSFLPACLFGIDSHDSESERYVYFSSVFALMFTAFIINVLITNRQAIKAVMAIVSLLFVFLLLNTLQKYTAAGIFSKQYTSALASYAEIAAKVYVVNQPSQYKGALMLRAFTRLPELREEHHTVLNEYMQYLHGNTKTEFITLSKKEILYPSSKLLTVAKPFDSAVYYFNEAGLIKENTVVDKNKIVIAGLRNDTLFIFR